jgi:hypothetical protein
MCSIRPIALRGGVGKACFLVICDYISALHLAGL